MSRITVCRVCLASNIRMQNIAQTRDQEIFEKLATKLHTDDRRPETLCYVCYSQLQRCRKFMEMSRRAENILTKFARSGIELTEDTVSILDRKFVYKVSWTPIRFLCINDVLDHNITQVKTEIKTEPSEESEPVNVKIDEIVTNIKTEPSEESEPVNVKIYEIVTNKNQLSEAVSKRETPTQCFSQREITTVYNNRDITINWGKYRTEHDVNERDKSTESVSEREISTGYNNTENRTAYGNESETPLQYGGMNIEVIQQVQGNILPKIHIVKEELVSDGEGDDDITGEFFDHGETETVKKEIESKSVIEEQELDAEFKEVSTDDKSYQRASKSDRKDRTRYTCGYCSKSYLMKCHLQRHMKLHRVVNGVPTRRYSCKLCSKSFVEKCILNRHIQIHYDDKKFCCDHCPTRCRQKNDLARHMLMHTGQKPFTCPVCKQTFSRKSNMKLHLLTHDDEKAFPFVCEICKSTFSRKYDLNRHNNRKHLGEKPFKCEICDFRSVNANYIKKHIDNIHINQGVPRFSCDICEFKCCQEGYLKIHKQKKHSEHRVKPLVLKIKKKE